MGKPVATEVTKEEVEEAHSMWIHFTKLMKWSSIAVAGVLVFLLFVVY